MKPIISLGDIKTLNNGFILIELITVVMINAATIFNIELGSILCQDE